MIESDSITFVRYIGIQIFFLFPFPISDIMDNEELKALGIDAGHYDIKSLFNDHNSKSKQQTLKRVKAILKIYSWINNNRRSDTGSNKQIINIYDLINTQLSPNYTFIRFQIDYQYIMLHQDLLGYDNVNDNVNDNGIDAQSQQDIAAYQAAVYNNNSLLLKADKISDDETEEICNGDTCYIEDRHLDIVCIDS